MMSEGDARPICFVVMGFGKKTDFESGRTLDLDKTYEHILQPAAEDAGYRPIRADDIWHSGVIDTVMYDMLCRAALVIADISTGNPNALYELGVRHALRPHSTIVMKEDQGRYYFDLDHVSTFSYKHLGEDIGASEAKRACGDLAKLIKACGKVDSPVYTYLPGLRQPSLTEEEFAQLVDEAEERQEHIAELVKEAEIAVEKSNFSVAFNLFSRAHELRPNEPYLVQSVPRQRLCHRIAVEN